ncbi:nucleolar complex protein 4 homolog A [Condylostylus longicornis]|uniref:nucleolar complex protein 4 homolog A n=1 Tax=Condylostylus longicornis TaxID=2530218 RepID=UPI00244DA8B2|nr:nucleolar complex protein 4 homolog A [Condylostylus longicornis]
MSDPNISNSYRGISKQLKLKANDFLNSRKHANNLVDLIQFFEESLRKEQNVSSCVLTLEVVFTELIKRRECYIEIKPLKPKDTSAETKYKEWLLERYEDFFRLLLLAFKCEKSADSTQALTTSMKLLSWEGKYPIEHNTPDNYYFPVNRFRTILIQLLSTEASSYHLIARFKEYSEYLDVVFYAWKVLPSLTPKGNAPSEAFVNNYLELINALPVTKELQESFKLLCPSNEARPEIFDYVISRKCINKAWQCVMQWEIKPATHKQILIVLLERVLPHLDKPVLLTDFLMDSLDLGGAIGLLALQGIFTLIQKHNITYPNIYEKLYSMFEPEIFHTKYKARLFYLADIFLSSTHLPENLVAAFVKRLARLSLLAPPQDVEIILYFIGNLILRHPGLKRLICHPVGGEVSQDPYIMDERDPTKSNALESSLWEIVALQSHIMPSISTAAKFISQPLPSQEWDLSNVLDLKEDDVFDQEISRKWKQCALSFERPQSISLPRNDKVSHYWKLF